MFYKWLNLLFFSISACSKISGSDHQMQNSMPEMQNSMPVNKQTEIKNFVQSLRKCFSESNISKKDLLKVTICVISFKVLSYIFSNIITILCCILSIVLVYCILNYFQLLGVIIKKIKECGFFSVNKTKK